MGIDKVNFTNILHNNLVTSKSTYIFSGTGCSIPKLYLQKEYF